MASFGAQPVAIGERVRLQARERPHEVCTKEWYELIRVSDHDFDAVRIVNGQAFGNVRYGVPYSAILEWKPARSFEELFFS